MDTGNKRDAPTSGDRKHPRGSQGTQGGTGWKESGDPSNRTGSVWVTGRGDILAPVGQFRFLQAPKPHQDGGRVERGREGLHGKEQKVHRCGLPLDALWAPGESGQPRSNVLSKTLRPHRPRLREEDEAAEALGSTPLPANAPAGIWAVAGGPQEAGTAGRAQAEGHRGGKCGHRSDDGAHSAGNDTEGQQV